MDETPAAVRDQIRRVITGAAPWPLVLLGNVGAGKSCAALCLLDRVACSRRYVSAQRFVDDCRAADLGKLERGGYFESIGNFWSAWRIAGVTCMDEMGSRSSREKVTDHHYETIKRAVDERHGKPCIWISNLSLDQLAQVYDDRIASRLAEGTQIVFTGRDRRVAR